MILSLTAAALLTAAPGVGSIAPDFTVKDIDGKELNLSKLVEKGTVILAFFPKAFTGGCTKEMQSYRDRHDEIQKLKGQVIAVSTDDADTLKKWRTELKAPQTFVADPDKKLTELFDVKMPVVGMASRHTFVIGPGRKVIEHTEGSDSIDTSKAVAACSLSSQKSGSAAPAAPPPQPKQ